MYFPVCRCETRQLSGLKDGIPVEGLTDPSLLTIRPSTTMTSVHCHSRTTWQSFLSRLVYPVRREDCPPFLEPFPYFHPSRALGNSGPLGSAETKTLNQSVQAEADLAHVTGISLCLSFAAPQPPLFLGRRLGQLKASITRLSLGLTQPAHPLCLRGYLSASEVSPIIAPKGWLKARNNGIFKTRY